MLINNLYWMVLVIAQGVDTNKGSKDFMAFGGGMRFCVGANYSKIQMSVFLYHLVTKYR